MLRLKIALHGTATLPWMGRIPNGRATPYRGRLRKGRGWWTEKRSWSSSSSNESLIVSEGQERSSRVTSVVEARSDTQLYTTFETISRGCAKEDRQCPFAAPFSRETKARDNALFTRACVDVELFSMVERRGRSRGFYSGNG